MSILKGSETLLRVLSVIHNFLVQDSTLFCSLLEPIIRKFAKPVKSYTGFRNHKSQVKTEI
jgi:hypothetical protein